ncbi:tRNA (guanine-N(7)-)-methyltransferase non-catalytic subunit trm82 [Schizosaccharomyces pombe]
MSEQRVFKHPCQFLTWNSKHNYIVCCSGPYLLGFSCSTGEKIFEHCYRDNINEKHREAAAYGEAIRQVAFSKDYSRMATVSEDKCLRLWDSTQPDKIELLYQKNIPKRCADLCFAGSNEIVFGDKFGDVYCVDENWFTTSEVTEEKKSNVVEGKQEPVNNETLKNSKLQKLEPIMGHVSILTQLIVAQNPQNSKEEIIITSDKDEHIRISRFPNAFVIEGFCLGHEDFVSRMSLYDNRTLISGGGDNHVFVWDLENFKCLDAFDLRSAFSTYLSLNQPMVVSVILPIFKRQLVAFACEGMAGLIFAKVTPEKRLLFHSALKLSGPVLDAVLLDTDTDQILISLDSSFTFGACFECVKFDEGNAAVLTKPDVIKRIESDGLISTEKPFCPLAQIHTLRKNHSKFIRSVETGTSSPSVESKDN